MAAIPKNDIFELKFGFRMVGTISKNGLSCIWFRTFEIRTIRLPTFKSFWLRMAFGFLSSDFNPLLYSQWRFEYIGGWNTECVLNSNCNSLFGFPMGFGFPMLFHLCPKSLEIKTKLPPFCGFPMVWFTNGQDHSYGAMTNHSKTKP